MCFTPYHLLVAEAITRATETAEADVVWGDEAGLGSEVDAVLVGGPLRVTLRLAAIGETRGLERGRVYLRNRRRIARWARGRQPGPLYLFNPLRPESRAVAERLASDLRFVEDGLEAYRPGRPRGRRVSWERRAASWLMGVKPFLRRNFIEYAPWCEAWALAPILVHAPGTTLQPTFRTIDPAALLEVAARWRPLALPDDGAVGDAVLAMLDLPSAAGGLTATEALAAASTWGVTPKHVILKPHPRDPRPMASIVSVRGATVIDRRWPAEVLLPTLRQGATVLGGESSAMLTAAVLRPDLDLRLRSRADSPLAAMLRTLNANVRIEGAVRA